MNHARAHDFGHGEAVSCRQARSRKRFSQQPFSLSLSPPPQSFSVRRQIYGPSGREGRNVYFTLAFAGVALMAAVFVGVAVAKYRASRSPHAQGFVEVDQVSAASYSNHVSVLNPPTMLSSIPDRRRSRHTRRASCSQYANQRIRKSNLQILRGQGIKTFAQRERNVLFL